MATSKNGSIAKALGIVALSALAGFAAVYVTIGGPDNAFRPVEGTKPAETLRLEAGEADRGGPTGKMAAFVRRAAPEPLPEITFQDSSGKTLTLSSFRGRTILLNLWATWCAPCREEMPSLDRLQKALGGEAFEVVALSLDRQGAAASQKFLDEVKADALKLYVDATAKQGSALRLVGMPTTLLIDKEGREVGRLAGPAEWDSDEAKALIKSAMN